MIPIRLVINNITDDIINIDLYGFTVKYKDMYYIVTLHMGLPIKEIIIDGIPKIENYILSKRNDLLIIPVLFPFKDQFVFCHFDEKQIDSSESYLCSAQILCKTIKLNSNVFLPINMMPNYPTIMYHIFNSHENIKVGMPVYNSDMKLRGIVSKMDDIVYVLPAHYIINTIIKDNNLLSMKDNIDNITKIDNKMIKNNKIYCKNHKTYIPIDCYLSYHMDINITTKQNITKKAIMIPHKNRIINSNELIRKDKEYHYTSGYIHLLQILGEFEMIERIISF
jgi:hypothetical protein